MADLPDIAAILTSLSGLSTSTLVFLSCVLLIGVIAFAVWLKNKRDIAKQEAKAAAEMEAAKKSRAAIHAGAFTGLQRAIEELRESISRRDEESFKNSSSFVKAFSELTNTVGNYHSELIFIMREGQRALVDTVKKGNEEQIRYLNIILNNSKGVINSTDSIRFIEALFEGVVRVEFIRIASRSLERNTYKGNESRVREFAVSAMTDVIRKVDKSLLEYNFSIRIDLFFQKDENGDYIIVNKAWGELENAHRERYIARKGESASDSAYIESVIIKIRRLITATFENARDKTLDIYYDSTPEKIFDKMMTPTPRNHANVSSN